MFDGATQDSAVGGPGTVVGANVKLTGTLSDVNDIIVHGTVEGEIISDKTVTISETASVKGPVTAQMVSVSGKVQGGITAHQKLELLPTANVGGAITTKELLIKPGATFNGKSTMTGEGAPLAKTEEVKKQDLPEQPKEKLPEKAEILGAAPTFELEE
ncbi:polymer-forming cytoskeletal protein [Candidatus Berkelbacteria bacterium]|nr:polymer-forming cytoskeletal protein [Candidatus Berkelbacteria bacterium]